jgi:F0F1-type ATP synthase epsilon subunit
MADPELHVEIKTSEETVFNGNAHSVMSKNSAGEFEVLPEHANFITLVENVPITVCTPEGGRSYVFRRAVVYVNDDTVKVFGEISL